MAPEFDDRSHLWKIFISGFGAIAIAVSIFFLFDAFSGLSDMDTETLKTEFSPDSIILAYQNMRAIAYRLDAKLDDVKAYESRLEATDAETPQYQFILSKKRDLEASYNSLASQYNSEMLKFGNAFSNPNTFLGVARPLPRKYELIRN